MSAFNHRTDWSMYIDGTFVPSSSGDRLQVVNPATGEEFASAPDGTSEDIDRAISAAHESFDDWRWVRAEERASLLLEIADQIEAHYDELVSLETLENGKPIVQSESDVTSAIEDFRFYAGAADKFYGDTVAHSPDRVHEKLYEPYGVVGVIIPWNWPPMHTADFASVALAAGNTVVLKPAPETPLSSIRIAELTADILPDGVFNVVTGGTEAGAALTGHADVDMLAFTGSDITGERVLEAAASHITPAMMELGGKNPEIIFPDAPLDKAVPGAVWNAFYNSGQACADTERLLVHEDIYDTFIDRLASSVEGLVVGDGFERTTQIGPMATEGQRDKVERYLEIIDREGYEVLAQAETPSSPDLADGFWAPPTIYTGIDPTERLAQQEIFGPLVAVMTFATEDEAVELANGTEFGLASTVWTSDLDRAHRMVSRLESGVVAVNSRSGAFHALPFGGYDRSGIGRKHGFIETMQEFSRLKSVRIDLTTDTLTL